MSLHDRVISDTEDSMVCSDTKQENCSAIRRYARWIRCRSRCGDLEVLHSVHYPRSRPYSTEDETSLCLAAVDMLVQVRWLTPGTDSFQARYNWWHDLVAVTVSGTGRVLPPIEFEARRLSEASCGTSGFVTLREAGIRRVVD